MDVDRIEQLYGDQIDMLKGLFDSTWWASDRALADIQRMLRQSDIVVGFCLPQSGELIAFARVLTDYVYKALILDLIVDERYRDQGVGRQLLNDIITHPLLGNVAHLELYCLPELVPFYEAWGFTADLDALCLLRRSKTAAA